MTDKPETDAPGQGFATRMSHLGRAGSRVRGYVNPPVWRASTFLHENVAERLAEKTFERSLGYGIGGNPTHHALEDVVCAIEGGARCQLVCSGLAAVTVPMLAFLGAGQHVLVPDSVYGPTRRFCETMLKRYGVTTTYYQPTIDAAGLAALFTPATKVLFLESPGSHTFEVQDVPALSEIAHAHGCKVLMDNTWGIHFFQPFRHGVDVSIQALTKYVGGHSDILLGSVTVADQADYQLVRAATAELGMYASSDDCWLALRGSRTLPVRLKQQMESGLAVAQWFAGRAEVQRVLHPALPGAPGHALWTRDFTGASSLFGVEFQPDVTEEAMIAMIDGLTLFGIGASWGGFESLVVPTTGTLTRTAGAAPAVAAARFHIGLEDPADLIADLSRSFANLVRR